VPRNPRHDVLFEPVKIGPLIARNRFFQVPHCNGMGYAKPRSHAAMRGIKAEGGWAVVSTEEVEIHPSSDLSPYIEGRLWDDSDIPCLEMMSRAVHEHGALAAIELREGFQEDFVRFVKTVTSKPVVGVGRFTSPDTMAAQIRRGILDFIGAARPSIADPFLPQKIADGDIDDIRECIGCNVCVTGDHTMTPIRCTQNPTMGEEWRKGWHPERVPPRTGADSFLIVGAGPSGLECARLLGRRGYEVHLAEADDEFGGRVARESRLPGLAAWARVRDYRLNQLNKMPNVTMLRANVVTAADVLEFGAARVVLATGARWRRDGVGRANALAIPGFEAIDRIWTPEDVMGGVIPRGPTVVFDDDHCYLGALLTEKLRAAGQEVALVTPADRVSVWTVNTLEQHLIQKRLLEQGVSIHANRNVRGFDGAEVLLECTYTARRSTLAAESIVTVTSRLPNDALATALDAAPGAMTASGIVAVTSIGDCLAPSTIAAAVYAGHRYAREFDPPQDDSAGFAREHPPL